MTATSIGARIKQKRLAKGWTQTELAYRCGWRGKRTQSRIGNYELNARVPELPDIQKLAQVLDCGIEYLAYGTRQRRGGEALQQVPILRWEQIKRVKNGRMPRKIKEHISLPSELRVSDTAFAVHVADNLMEPEFKEGDIVVIDPQATVWHGRFVIVMFHGESNPVLRRYFCEGKRCYFITLDKQMPAVMQNETSEIYGVVVMKLKFYP